MTLSGVSKLENDNNKEGAEFFCYTPFLEGLIMIVHKVTNTVAQHLNQCYGRLDITKAQLWGFLFFQQKCLLRYF